MHFEAFPSYRKLSEMLDGMVRENPGTMRFENIGSSAEGKDVRAIHVSSQTVPLEEKEVVLIVCGRHGDELGTRVAGPSVLDWLLCEEAAGLLEKQHIIVVPIANPDGCEKDIFGLPSDRLSRLEEESVVRLAKRYLPDLVIDVHSVGKEKHNHDWGGLQAVVIDSEANTGEDRQIAYKIAEKMIEDGCAEGSFFLLHDVEFYRNLARKSGGSINASFNNYFNRACYNAFHSLTFGIELNHFVMTPDAVGHSAKVIIKSLLRQGNHRFPWQRHAGYPNGLLRGDFLASIRAIGQTAHERRISRKKIWQNIAAWDLSRKMPDPDTIVVSARFTGEIKAATTAEVCFFSAGRKPVTSILLNGKRTPYFSVPQKCGDHFFLEIKDPVVERGVEIITRF